MRFESVFELVSLGDVATFINGDRSTNYPKGDDYIADGIPFISAADLSESRIQQSYVKRISNQAYDRLRSGKIRHQDILFCLRGSIGKMAYVQKNEVGAIASSLVIVRSTAKIDSRYLYYILCSQAGQQAASSLNNGSAQPNLSVGELQKVKIPLPSKAIQLEIASILNCFDDQITLLRETNTTLENIAQSIFKSWFVDFDPVRAKSEGKLPEGMNEATAALFPEAFEETAMGRVPVGWQISSLSSVATFQNGYAFKSSDWIEQGHPVIKIGNVKSLLIDFDGCSFVSPKTVVDLDRFKLIRGDLLVGMTGYVGETGLVTRSEVAGYLNQRVGRLATSKGLDDLGFLFAAVRQAEFKAYAESQSHGSAQANVSGAELMKFSVVKPSAQVLEVFNQIVGKLIEKILNNYEKVNSLVNLRDILLPRLISGQLLVAEAEAELEKVIV
jgi:type I restriction enzyme S subunit